MTIAALYLLHTVAAILVGTNPVNSLLNIETLKIRENTRVELSCDPDVTQPVTKVTWYHVRTRNLKEISKRPSDADKISEWTNGSITYHQQNRYGYLDYKPTGKFFLIVKSVTATTNDATFCCFVGNINTRCFWIDVQVPVKRVELLGSHRETKGSGLVLDVRAGAVTRVTCRAPEARPPPSITWTLQENRVPQENATHSDHNSVLVLSSDRSMQGHNLTCTATNVLGIDEVHSVSTTASLDVLPAPTPPAGPTTPVAPTTPSVTVKPPVPPEDPPSTLLCRSEGQSDGRQYQCGAVNPEGKNDISLQVDIFYPTEVNVTLDKETQKLTCSVPGQTAGFTFSLSQNPGGRVIGQRGNTTTGSPLSVTRLPYTTNTTGLYRCNVTNGIHEGGQNQPFFRSKNPGPGLFLTVVLAVFGCILTTSTIVFICIGVLRLSGLSVKVAKRRKDRQWWPVNRLSAIYYSWRGNPPTEMMKDAEIDSDAVYFRDPIHATKFKLSDRRRPINSVLSNEDLHAVNLTAMTLCMEDQPCFDETEELSEELPVPCEGPVQRLNPEDNYMTYIDPGCSTQIVHTYC